MVREQALYPYNLSILEDLANNVTNELIDELFQLENEIGEDDDKNPASQHIIDSLPVKLAKVSTEQCAICLEKINKKQQECTLHCQHTFHSHCIKNWLKRDNSCPICRKELSDKHVSKDYIFVTIYFPDSSILYKSFHIHTNVKSLIDTINKYLDNKKDKILLKSMNDNSITNIDKLKDKSLQELGFQKDTKIRVFS